MDIAQTSIAVLEILGTVSFAVAGSMIAINKKLDILGVMILGVTTAIGGGIMRDIILGNVPPKSFLHYGNLLIATCVSFVVFIIARILKERYMHSTATIEAVNNVFDALGLSIFTITGINECLTSAYADNVFLALFLGVITGVGGGALRDVMIQETPFILKKRVYAVASVLGGSAYYLLHTFGAAIYISVPVSIAITFGIRICATIFKWNLPRIK